MALARSNGSIIRNLDADDLLTPGALGRDILAYQRHPHIGWTTAPALDLHEDGTTSPALLGEPTAGVVEPGWLAREWAARHYAHLPVVPGTLTMRRDLIVRLGGWMALPTSEDTGLLVAASELSPGYLHATPGLLYRKHADQISATPDHRNDEHARQRRDVILARARLLAT